MSWYWLLPRKECALNTTVYSLLKFVEYYSVNNLLYGPPRFAGFPSISAATIKGIIFVPLDETMVLVLQVNCLDILHVDGISSVPASMKRN